MPAPTGLASIRSHLAEAERALAAGPHPEKARRDAEELLLLALRRDVPEANRAWLLAHQDEAARTCVASALAGLVERRLAGEPIQYVAGEAEFFGLLFRVTPDVLIPRPETECVVERVVSLCGAFRRPRIVDVGTGSGAIAVALARTLPDAQIWATEISPAALAVAQENATRNRVGDRVRLVHGDLLAPVAGEHFDIVVSNPPYVGEGDRTSLSVEVRGYEPELALFAGEDGLAVYRRLIPAARGALGSGGYLVLEIGYGQADAVHALLAPSGFAQIEFTADLQGIPRVGCARRL